MVGLYALPADHQADGCGPEVGNRWSKDDDDYVYGDDVYASVYMFVLLWKTSVDKPLLEYMSKSLIQDNIHRPRVDGSQEH